MLQIGMSRPLGMSRNPSYGGGRRTPGNWGDVRWGAEKKDWESGSGRFGGLETH